MMLQSTKKPGPPQAVVSLGNALSYGSIEDSHGREGRSSAWVIIVASVALFVVFSTYAWNARTMSVTKYTTTTILRRQPTEVFVTGTHDDDASNSTTLLFERLQCFAHRFTYSCSEEHLRAFIESRAAEFEQVEQMVEHAMMNNNQGSNNSIFQKDILVLGNSHAGQVGEALLCAVRKWIVHFMATDLYTGCLVPHNNLAVPCDGSGHTNACGMYLASATLKNGIRIHLANNHPWLFGGPERLTAALDHMHIRPHEDLGLVLLSPWNSGEWAKKNMGDMQRQAKGNYPVPQLTPAYYRCGGGYNFSSPTTNSTLNRLTVPWTTDGVLDYFAKRNFTGTMLLGTLLDRVSAQNKSGYYPFAIRQTPPTRHVCDCGECTPNPGQHSCMPGEPFLWLKVLFDAMIVR